jgi:hypothetical protein
VRRLEVLEEGLLHLEPISLISVWP